MTRTITAMAVATMMAGVAASGCTTTTQDAPANSGPSVLGTSISMFASPDILRQDGVSQSQITVQAVDANGQAIRNLPIRLDIWIGDTIVDFGELSGKNLITGSDGRATAAYTAPPAPAQAVDTATVVRISATPGGSDYANAVLRTVSIRLVPTGVVLPPNGAPTASFVYAPSSPLTQATVTFDGSSSSDADGTIVSYAWNFGDGSTRTGSLVQHQYTTAGTYSVSLTVTDDRGLTGTKSLNVAVTEANTPTPRFTSSPSAPVVNEKVFFNASASTAATGRTIVRYDWDYGNGRQDSGLLAWEIFTKPGTYNVVLTVTDDAGKAASVSNGVVIGGNGLTAVATNSPRAPNADDAVFFDASGSTGTYPITSYSWDFGDGNTATGVKASHKYTSTGPCAGGIAGSKTFVVRLTIQDANGQTATTTLSVTVGRCGPA